MEVDFLVAEYCLFRDVYLTREARVLYVIKEGFEDVYTPIEILLDIDLLAEAKEMSLEEVEKARKKFRVINSEDWKALRNKIEQSQKRTKD